MGEFTSAQAGAVQTAVATDIYRWLHAGGFLTGEGIRAVRSQLETGGYAPGPRLELARLDADQALAKDLGCELSELPDRGVPDSPTDDLDRW